MDYIEKKQSRSFNEIKGLTSGLFCIHVCGNYKYRNDVYIKYYKEYVEQGLFIRSIENAPRDSRYKIDWYFKDGVEHSTETLDYEYIKYYKHTLIFLGIDECFSPSELKKYKNHKCDNEFELCYGIIDCPNDVKMECYYFKYKGEPNTLIFNYKPELVNYNTPFWGKYKGYIRGEYQLYFKIN